MTGIVCFFMGKQNGINSNMVRYVSGHRSRRCRRRNGDRRGNAIFMTGAWPSNTAPKVKPILINNKPMTSSVIVSPGSQNIATISVLDPDKDAVMYDWIVLTDTPNKLSGGDKENEPGEIGNLIVSQKDGMVVFKAPGETGSYWLYVYIYDGHNHLATGNFPFYVE